MGLSSYRIKSLLLGRYIALAEFGDCPSTSVIVASLLRTYKLYRASLAVVIKS
jgi:hypothetical protein